MKNVLNFISFEGFKNAKNQLFSMAKLNQNTVEALKLKHHQLLTTYQFLWISILTVTFSVIIGSFTGIITFQGIPIWVNILVIAFVVLGFYEITNRTLVRQMKKIQDRIAEQDIEKILVAFVTPVATYDQLLGIIVIVAIIFGLAYLLSR